VLQSIVALGSSRPQARSPASLLSGQSLDRKRVLPEQPPQLILGSSLIGPDGKMIEPWQEQEQEQQDDQHSQNQIIVQGEEQQREPESTLSFGS
jgi:hypothetical protein